ncbi:MAG TPA: hypothetical protein VMV86_02005 [Methanosarcinales archaeon]|nr:hypothetical protein [Methanosarcinales archaeon]
MSEFKVENGELWVKYITVKHMYKDDLVMYISPKDWVTIDKYQKTDKTISSASLQQYTFYGYDLKHRPTVGVALAGKENFVKIGTSGE